MSKRKNKNRNYHYDVNRRASNKFTNRQIEEALYENEVEAADLAESESPNQEAVVEVSQSIKGKIYVLDTNILLACPDIIYDPEDPDWEPV
jgi:hypothetical protein